MKADGSALGGTKGEALSWLAGLVRTARVEPLMLFPASDWPARREELVVRAASLGSRRLIVRSSSRDEDGFTASNAGHFTSVLGVPGADPEKIAEAVDRVIASYGPRVRRGDQVLVQAQTESVALSGVLFTRALGTNAPYYEIAYDDSGDTSAVTSGRGGRKLLISRFAKGRIQEPWGKLIALARELEKLCGPTPLDVEFAVCRDGSVVLFQARPLAANRSIPASNDRHIERVVHSYRERFDRYNRRFPHLAGSRTIFGDMPDWNPAEMLSAHPYTLAYTLYRHLITDEIWHRARAGLGYYDCSPAHLMVTFGRKPYIDCRLSFNSMTPADLPEGLRDRLVDHYLDELEANPSAQDKVEFEILWTGFDFSTRRRVEGLAAKGFTKAERARVVDSLRRLTNSILGRFDELSSETEAAVAALARRREDTLAAARRGKPTPWDLITYAYILLDHARHYGTLPFSSMARVAFLSHAILRSMRDEGLISAADLEAFLKSNETVATEFSRDAARLDEREFLRRYGHLRPGSYDITAPRYDQMAKHLHSGAAAPEAAAKRFRLGRTALAAIGRRMRAEGLAGSPEALLAVGLESARRRELIKFEFTKNLSEGLELIARAGAALGISREELQFLHYADVLKYRNPVESNTKSAREALLRLIAKRRSERALHDRIPLPELIVSSEDFLVIRAHQSRPNFVTSLRIEAAVVEVSGPGAAGAALEGKIALIESADPGYDWIFSRRIAGLVTRYGGAASHMAIRCAEFGIPAAIGVGGELFERLRRHPFALLDCDGERLHPVA